MCKIGPPDAMDQALLSTGSQSRIETVSTLAEAMVLCLRERIDRLIVNMFSFTPAELTSLLLFRELRPQQRIVLFCPDEALPMLTVGGLADECHPITVTKPAKDRTYRARI